MSMGHDDRSGPRGRDTGTFSAVFDELELVDVLQLLHQARRSATVVVEGHGAIRFERGEMCHAQAGDLVGVPALEALLAVKGGDVKVKDPRPGPHTLDAPFQHLMLDTMTRLDEASQGAFPAPQQGAYDPFAAVSDSAGTGAFEWGPASPAPDGDAQISEAFDALLDYEFVGEEPGGSAEGPAAPAVVIAPPKVAASVATAPVSTRTPVPQVERPLPSWQRMTDARRPTPDRGLRRVTGPMRATGPNRITYKLPQLPEPAVEIYRAPPPPPAPRSNMGFVLVVGVLCVLLGVGIAAYFWGPAAERAPEAPPAAATP